MEREINKAKTLAKLMDICSKREVCSGKARELMWRWGVPPVAQDEIMGELVKYKYIDDLRYARFFVRDKSRFSAWGRHKIAASLREKRIAPELIRQAIEEEYPELDSNENLRRIVRQKAENVRYKDFYDLRNKLIRYGLSRGYESEDVIKEVENIIRDKSERLD